MYAGLWIGSFPLLAPAQARPEPAAPTASAPVNTDPLVTEAELDAPVRKVWDVFTTDEGFKNFGAAQAHIDLRVGGKIQSHYNPQGVLGDEGTIENTIIAYEPEHVFAFRISKPPKGFPFMNAFQTVWSVATMTDLGDGRTHLRLAMCGYTADDESQQMRRFFDQGNAWVMEKLKQNLAGGARAVPEKPRAADSAVLQDPLGDIECTIVIPAMPDEVWKCWTTSAGVKSFLTDAKVELKIGGAYEFYFRPDGPLGQRGSEGCKVLSFEPPRMLSFSWNAPPDMPYARVHPNWVVLHIDPAGPHGSKVTLRHMGFAELAAASPEHAAEFRQAREHFVKAWPMVLAALRNKFEASK